VVDLTSNIAAPFAGAVLADLGAHVVHVEPPQGDDSRRMNPVIEQESAYFRVVNRRKEFLTLDLRTQEDVATLMNLIGQADVFLTNLRPKRLNELGLNESSLREKHPQLITGYLTAYGDHTPEGNQAGYDGVVQARTGIVSVTGSGEPARAGVSVLDIGSGTWLALGVISALFNRERTGIGSCISTSLMETGVHWSGYHIAAHQITGEVSRRSGTAHPAFEPYGIYDTSDGQVLIGVGGDSVFIRLARALDADWMIDDPRFLSNTQRVAYREALRLELEEIVNKLTNTRVINALREADVPVDIVQLPEDLLQDPGASAQLGNHAMRIPSLPFRINNTYPGN
jgi:crotonobetainyl-CoA:carnitine CoA-transferase CaiB-like acyl-CoA transferase